MRDKMQVVMTQEEFQEIANKPLPEAEELFEPLITFHSMLYDAFGYSLVRANKALRKTHNKKSTKWFKPQAIRFYVHDFLSQKGIETQLVDGNNRIEGDELIFETRVSPNNGIAGNIDGYEYIVLKMYNGGLPPPVSHTRKQYHKQSHLRAYEPTLPGLSDRKPSIFTLKPNLFYLWEIVKNRIDLYLAIPKHPLLYAQIPLVLIPNPITTLGQADIEVEEEIVIEEQYGELNDIRRAH